MENKGNKAMDKIILSNTSKEEVLSVIHENANRNIAIHIVGSILPSLSVYLARMKIHNMLALPIFLNNYLLDQHFAKSISATNIRKTWKSPLKLKKKEKVQCERRFDRTDDGKCIMCGEQLGLWGHGQYFRKTQTTNFYCISNVFYSNSVFKRKGRKKIQRLEVKKKYEWESHKTIHDRYEDLERQLKKKGKITAKFHGEVEWYYSKKLGRHTHYPPNPYPLGLFDEDKEEWVQQFDDNSIVGPKGAPSGVDLTKFNDYIRECNEKMGNRVKVISTGKTEIKLGGNEKYEKMHFESEEEKQSRIIVEKAKEITKSRNGVNNGILLEESKWQGLCAGSYDLLSSGTLSDGGDTPTDFSDCEVSRDEIDGSEDNDTQDDVFDGLF
jgi:hypothetical protein